MLVLAACLLLIQGFTLEDVTGLKIKGDVDVHGFA